MSALYSRRKFYKIFGSLLKRARKIRGHTQLHVAELVGSSQSVISRWECGTAFPDLYDYFILVREYGVSVDIRRLHILETLS